MSPNVREIDLARFQGASWASPLMICVSIFSGLGIGTGELFFFFFFLVVGQTLGKGAGKQYWSNLVIYVLLLLLWLLPLFLYKCKIRGPEKLRFKFPHIQIIISSISGMQESFPGLQGSTEVPRCQRQPLMRASSPLGPSENAQPSLL